jgi:hypothetical protein
MQRAHRSSAGLGKLGSGQRFDDLLELGFFESLIHKTNPPESLFRILAEFLSFSALLRSSLKNPTTFARMNQLPTR